MKHFKKYLFSLVCCLFYAARMVAQSYNYAHYTTRDGLAGETLYGITQDAEGFMWFGTETGLSRFDGQQFKTFTVADGLPSNEVFGFHEDSQQRLWIKSFSNELCYYYKGKIHNKANTPMLKSLVMTAFICDIMETRQGEIIIVDEAGIVAVLDKSGKIRKYNKGHFTVGIKDVLEGSSQTHMLRLPGWMKAELDKYLDEDRGLVKSAVIKNNTVFVIIRRALHSESLLWYNGYDSFKLITRPERLNVAVLNGNNILEAYRTGGAGIFNLSSGQRTSMFLPEFTVNGVYQDRDRNIWLGTKWNGLYKLSNRDIFSFAFNVKNASPAVQFVQVSKGRVFVGDDNGVLWKICDTGTGQYAAQYSGKKEKLYETIEWLKTNAPGRCINYNGSDFLHLRYIGNSYGVKSLFLAEDTLVVAACDCAYRCTLGKPQDTIRIHQGRATCAAKYNGYYYIGTLHGLYVYNEEGQLIGKPISNRISYFANGKDGQIWVSTYDNGIYSLLDHKVVTIINTKNSLLSSNLIRCIFYKDNQLWAGTDKGINKISITDTSPVVTAVYNLNNGLNSDIINTIFVDSAMVYAGTAAGLNIFSNKLKVRDTSFNIVFTRIAAGDINTDFDQSIILPHKDNSISFDYSGISFSTDKITYRYRVLGLSSQWQKTTEQTLSFIALPSGKYRLQVQAFSPDGTKSGIIEKSFEVRQSILEYWWIRLLLVLLAGIAIFLITYFRIRKIKKTEAQKRAGSRRMIELEQMALRAQMNPHFIFNCLNSVQHYILRQDAAGANYYLAQFAGLVRQTLENSSKLLITLQEEISYLKRYIELERLQVNFPFDYTFSVDADIITSGIFMPNMIIQPFIENALKHGLGKKESDGHLAIRIHKEAGMLLWSITDNGPGIDSVKNPRQSIHQSRGIALIEKRIGTLNSMMPDLPEITFKIEDLHESGSQGTIVVVAIPIMITLPVNP